jgi:hypothetical protein
VQLFAGLEADRFAGSDRNFCASSWITTDASLPWFDGEDAKAAEFDAVASDESSFHALEDCVNGGLRFRPWQASSLNHPLYQILLNHFGSPSLGCNLFETGYFGPGFSTVMLETRTEIVNARTLP